MQNRLLSLEGHLDPEFYKSIASRLRQTLGSTVDETLVQGGKEPVGEVELLDDLLLEAEIFAQYQLTGKVKDQLEKINKLHPGAEESNPRLKELYEGIGFTPSQPEAASTPSPATPASKKAAEKVPEPAAPVESLDDLKKVTALVGNIYREVSPQGVLKRSVEEIGKWLRVSRCWGALGSPDGAPNITREYCSATTQASDAKAALKLHAVLRKQVAAKPDGWSVDDVAKEAPLSAVKKELQTLGIRSLLALPLLEGDQPVGLIVLEACENPRPWKPNEGLLLRTLGSQIAIALNTTKLRRLVRTLAGTDSSTGFLPRSAYLDCLMAEVSRAKDQDTCVSVSLFELDKGAALYGMVGDKGLQELMEAVGKALLGSVRQTDITIRYSPYSIALIFPDTPLEPAARVAEKLRAGMTRIRMAGKPVSYCSAVAEVRLGENFEPADGVTELINRIEGALVMAQKKGGNRTVISKFSSCSPGILFLSSCFSGKPGLSSARKHSPLSPSRGVSSSLLDVKGRPGNPGIGTGSGLIVELIELLPGRYIWSSRKSALLDAGKWVPELHRCLRWPGSPLWCRRSPGRHWKQDWPGSRNPSAGW